jgi:hypothetical protein
MFGILLPPLALVFSIHFASSDSEVNGGNHVFKAHKAHGNRYKAGQMKQRAETESELQGVLRSGRPRSPWWWSSAVAAGYGGTGKPTLRSARWPTLRIGLLVPER